MTDSTKPIVWGASLLAMTMGLFAQTPAAAPGAARLEFEVASVKPAAPITPGMFRFGMRVDEGRVDYANVSLRDCIRTAYRLSDFQISGPDWLSAERFDIVAKLPAGATKDQVPEMLQALLADRFKIAVRHESKVHDTYALVVAKNGPKLTAAAPVEKPDPSAGAGSGPKIFTMGGGGGGTVASGGIAAVPRTGARMSVDSGGTIKIPAKNQTLGSLAELLARFVGGPVVDLTEIQGNYDFMLEMSMGDLSRGSGITLKFPNATGGGDAANPAGSSDSDGEGMLFKSIQNYGLKLDRRKAPLDQLIIEHIEKVPTEN